MQYTNYKNPNINSKDEWSVSTISNILKDRIYVGDLVQHKYRKINYKVKKIVKTNNNEQIIIQNNHQALINRDDFNKVNNMLISKSNECKRLNKINHILTGIAFCKKCNSRITYTKNHGNDFKIICSNYKQNGKNACDNIYVNEPDIIEIIRENIIQRIKENKINKIIINENAERKIQYLNNQKQKNIEAIKQVYKDILEKNIDANIGRQVIEEYTRKNESIEKNYNTEKEIDVISKIEKLKGEDLRKLIFMLINKIEISKTELVIYYKFRKYF